MKKFYNRGAFYVKEHTNILSPDLLKILMEMGHGNEIVIADGNFPAASVAQKLIRLDGLVVLFPFLLIVKRLF